MPLRVLLVEDSVDDADLILHELRASGLEVACQRVETAVAMERALLSAPWDIVLSDYGLPRFSAGKALELLLRVRPDVPFIIVSGLIGEEAAVALVKAGALDFVMKSNLGRLQPVIDRSLREAEIRRQHRATLLALQESEARFKALASNLPGVIFQAVCRGNDELKLAYISDGCQPLFGVSPEAARAQPDALIRLIVPEDHAAFQHSLRQARKYSRVQNWEGRIRLPATGEVKWVNLRASVRELPGGDVMSEGIISNITQGKRSELDLLRSREQLRELSSHLNTVKEQERASIAREIHDELGGTLTAAKIDLLWLTRRLPADNIEMRTKAASVEILLDQALEIGRRVARSLRPGILDYGIAATIEWQAREFEKRLGIPCAVACANDEMQLDPDLSTALFRIFQETLTNIAKHADAHRVDVTLSDDGNVVVLEVVDDGRGIGEEDLAKPGSFGIRGMLERAQTLGGTLVVGARARGGTQVRVSIPKTRLPAVPDPEQRQQIWQT